MWISNNFWSGLWSRKYLSFLKFREQLFKPRLIWYYYLTKITTGFEKLGLRVSKYSLKSSAELFNSNTNGRNVNYRKMFYIAFKEELLAMRNRYTGALNTDTVPWKIIIITFIINLNILFYISSF